MLRKSLESDGEDQFYVSDSQRDELSLTIRIMKAIPQIFQGRNGEAIQQLRSIMCKLEDNNSYHLEYSTVLNSIGLAVQRGHGDKETAMFFYWQTLKERMHLINICPQDLVAPYNNLAMLQFQAGEKDKALQNLYNALDIRRRHRWKNYYTALTLTHLGDIHLKQDKLVAALDFYSQADEILAETTKKHDFRIRVNLSLAHLSLAIDLKKSSIDTNRVSICDCAASSNTTFVSRRNTGLSVNQRPTNGAMPQSCQNDCRASLLDACSHKKSAKHYFENMYPLAFQSQGSLSDHGHGQLLCSLIHLILMEWANVGSVSIYLERITTIMTTYPWVIKELQKPEEKRVGYMNGHYDLYRYLTSADLCHLDVKKLVRLMLPNCGACHNTKYFSETNWENIMILCQRRREDLLLPIRSCQTEANSTQSSIQSLDSVLESSQGEYPQIIKRPIENALSDCSSKSETNHAESSIKLEKNNNTLSCHTNSEAKPFCESECIQLQHRSIDESSWRGNDCAPMSEGILWNNNSDIDESSYQNNIPCILPLLNQTSSTSEAESSNPSNPSSYSFHSEHHQNKDAIKLQKLLMESFQMGSQGKDVHAAKSVCKLDATHGRVTITNNCAETQEKSNRQNNNSSWVSNKAGHDESGFNSLDTTLNNSHFMEQGNSVTTKKSFSNGNNAWRVNTTLSNHCNTAAIEDGNDNCPGAFSCLEISDRQLASRCQRVAGDHPVSYCKNNFPPNQVNAKRLPSEQDERDVK